MTLRPHTTLLIALLLAAPAGAQNLLANSTFDCGPNGTIPGWLTPDLQTTCDAANDADGAPSSGSAVRTTSTFTPHFELVAWQIVPVTPGERYFYRGSFLLSPSDTEVSARVQVNWMNATSCFVEVFPQPPPAVVTTLGSWVPTATLSAVAPPDTACARVALFHVFEGAGTATVHADNVFFSLGPPVDVPTLSPVAFGLQALLILLAAAWHFRRARAKSPSQGAVG